MPHGRDARPAGSLGTGYRHGAQMEIVQRAVPDRVRTGKTESLSMTSVDSRTSGHYINLTCLKLQKAWNTRINTWSELVVSQLLFAKMVW